MERHGGEYRGNKNAGGGNRKKSAPHPDVTISAWPNARETNRTLAARQSRPRGFTRRKKNGTAGLCAAGTNYGTHAAHFRSGVNHRNCCCPLNLSSPSLLPSQNQYSVFPSRLLLPGPRRQRSFTARREESWQRSYRCAPTHAVTTLENRSRHPLRTTTPDRYSDSRGTRSGKTFPYRDF